MLTQAMRQNGTRQRDVILQGGENQRRPASHLLGLGLFLFLLMFALTGAIAKGRSTSSTQPDSAPSLQADKAAKGLRPQPVIVWRDEKGPTKNPRRQSLQDDPIAHCELATQVFSIVAFAVQPKEADRGPSAYLASRSHHPRDPPAAEA